jgi:tRNA dimethylallyltransferase
VSSAAPAPHPLIAVVGPTGSGKSDLALTIAERFGGEIVNCDSVQLYRHMDIGTAKTPPDERRGIPHHLIDVLDPDEHFTAGDYAHAARQVVSDIAARAAVPVLAGGTGFYLRALLSGLSEGPPRDLALRARLERRSPEALHRLLRRFDPASAAHIHPNDRNKLIRALEICLLTRTPRSEFFRTGVSRPLEGFRVFKIGIDPGREVLAERIAERTRRMFDRGLLDEVRHILAMGFSPASKALQSIGYREALLCLRGVLTLNEAVERTTVATRQYAKRQRTWFRREPDVLWLSGSGSEEKVAAEAVHHLSVGIKFS